MRRAARFVTVLTVVIAACGSDEQPSGASDNVPGLSPTAGAAAAAPAQPFAGNTVGAAGTAGVPATPTAGVGVTPQAGDPAAPAAGMAGVAVEPMAGTQEPVAGAGGAMEPVAPAEDACVLAMDECPQLNTQWPGDEFCIAPPPEDQGFQVHVGPPSYDNPPANYITQPGEDTLRTFTAVSGNTSEIFYYRRQYRMRAGSHHLILNGGGGNVGITGGRRLGGSSNSAKDNPDCGIVAPENEGIGMRLGPNTTISFNLHYFNITDEPVLNEAWVNFWYKDPATVTEEANEMFLLGDVAFAIPPGAHQTIGPNRATVPGSGRIVTMYGHYHANTIRFSAWRERGGQRELILEDYDWHDPLILEYSSVAENPAPNPSLGIAGGWNGMLDIQAGDTLIWECEVQNETTGTLRFTNEAVSGEMCILIGDTVGTTVSGLGGFGGF